MDIPNSIFTLVKITSHPNVNFSPCTSNTLNSKSYSISAEFILQQPCCIKSLCADLHTAFYFLGLLNVFSLQCHISQTHSCVNAAGPRLAARCVKAKESFPLLKERIHQNHLRIAKVEQLSPGKGDAKKKSIRVADCVIVELSLVSAHFQAPTLLCYFCLQSHKTNGAWAIIT